MRFKTMATVTAMIFIVAGMGFAFQDMNLVRGFGPAGRLPALSQQSVENRRELLLWFFSLRSFVYMFGSALIGCGLLTWAIRNLKDATTQTNATMALFGLNTISRSLGAYAAAFNLEIEGRLGHRRSLFRPSRQLLLAARDEAEVFDRDADRDR
ncbi:MAG: hypothetical protein JMDDDDMK_05204 [Acidobacteria bacterium]|nr:hypothetical protein [Acidobacteriota bacterium]